MIHKAPNATAEHTRLTYELKLWAIRQVAAMVRVSYILPTQSKNIITIIIIIFGFVVEILFPVGKIIQHVFHLLFLNKQSSGWLWLRR